jgi:hypothetical protein
MGARQERDPRSVLRAIARLLVVGCLAGVDRRHDHNFFRRLR